VEVGCAILQANEKEMMISFLCETIRYINSVNKLISNSFAVINAKKYNSANNRIVKKITELQNALNVELIDFRGSSYTAELPVEVLNLEDFEENQELIITETLEPTIKEKDSSHILRFGKVIVAAKEA
jgi:hypothetical protein